MNGCLVLYIEIDIALRIDNEEIMSQFQNMKNHRKNCKILCISKKFFFFLVLFFVISIYSISLLFYIFYNLYFLLTPLKNNLGAATAC